MTYYVSSGTLNATHSLTVKVKVRAKPEVTVASTNWFIHKMLQMPSQ